MIMVMVGDGDEVGGDARVCRAMIFLNDQRLVIVAEREVGTTGRH